MFKKLSYEFLTEGYHSNMITPQYENTNFEESSALADHCHCQYERDRQQLHMYHMPIIIASDNGLS